ncbi:hypothetical protein C8A00DRAFT_39198 [Chaetomidium leptoderma]|uniref:FAD-binding domain-containing protein n=1 Tax=Chaetomidium leptoderma TaxID=669021 RepID=A0AAN6VW55_9PEZI|nr:hypothetical protein C8A00DRAFT_39198 [Chaetomidium leptoderma]
MRSEMKCDEIDEQRDQWIETLDDIEMCRLASSFRGGDQCTSFQPRKHGAFNVCFFVEFESPRERWVIRIPMPVNGLPKAVLDEKTEVELATMRYVSSKTTIPIPKVHAYAFSDTGPNGLPFIIMDYVDGQSLKDLGFSDVYVQLRQLEFPQIGALGLPSRDTPALSCSPEEIRVCNRPLSMDMVLQEIDGLEPGEVFPPKGTFPTAQDFVDGLLWMAGNMLEKEPDQKMDENEPGSILYAAHHFKRFIQDEWLDRSANEGPFVLADGFWLVHGDMDVVMSNLLFDKDYNLVGVIDWEWSRVVPAQLMVPPIWLIASTLDFVLLIQSSYNQQIRYLRAAVEEREKALGLPPLLSVEWAPLETCFLYIGETDLDGDSGAALHLCPNAGGILQHWGIHAGNFGACLMSRFIELAQDGQTLKDIDLTESNARWPHPWHLVHRAAFHQELKRVAVSEDGVGLPVKLFPKRRVSDVDPLLGVTLDDGTLVLADVLIGADGLYSRTRQAIIKSSPLFRTGKAAFRFVMPRSLAESDPTAAAPVVTQKDTLTIWFADDRRVVMYPCNNNEWLNFVCIHPDTESHTAPTDEWNRQASLDQVLHVFKDFDPRLKALFAKANPATIQVWQLLDMDKLPTWTSGKLALIGDAAHPCLPYQAQGGAQAIEDAAALAAVLPQGTPPEDVPDRLKLYESIRSERAHTVQHYSRVVGQNCVDGEPVVDMREFENYNFDHDEVAHAAAAFKQWEASRKEEISAAI